MEIIEEGNKIYECETCGCKFKITSDKEIKRGNWKYIDKGFLLADYRRTYYDSVRCPQCGNEVIIKWR